MSKLSKVTTWWKKPSKHKTNGGVMIAAFIDGVGNGLRNHKISELEKRIKALEQGRTHRRPSDDEVQAYVKSIFGQVKK